MIYNWISDHDIKVLNVAGPRSSKDTKIYDATIYILEDVYSIILTEHQMDVSLMFNHRWKDEEHPNDMPKTPGIRRGGFFPSHLMPLICGTTPFYSKPRQLQSTP